MVMPKILISLDCAMHKTGLASFGIRLMHPFVVDLTSTETVKVSNKTTGENACIEMISKILSKIRGITFNSDVRAGEVIIVCEIQKPHKDDRMSKQAFAHMLSVPLGVLGASSYHGYQTAMYTPVQWKGTVPKKLMLQKIYANEVVNATDPKLFSMKEPDILDAIGLGRFHIEKMKLKERTKC